MRQVLTDFAEEVNVGTQRLTKFHEKITREDEVNLENEISDLDKLFQEKGKKKTKTEICFCITLQIYNHTTICH